MSTASPDTRSPWRIVLAFALGALVGAIGARAASSPSPSTTGAASELATGAARERAPRADADAGSPGSSSLALTTVASAPVSSSAIAPDAGRPAAGPDAERAAREGVGALLRTFQAAERMHPEDAPLEARVNAQSLYLSGWLDAMRAEHGSFSYLAPVIDEQLCRSGASSIDVAAALAIATRARESVTTRGLDCVLARATGEDETLWWALDAWNRSQLPSTPELERWRAAATDPRTLRRLDGPRVPEL